MMKLNYMSPITCFLFQACSRRHNMRITDKRIQDTVIHTWTEAFSVTTQYTAMMVGDADRWNQSKTVKGSIALLVV